MSILNTDEFDKVTGEIYKITNIVTNKCYIGQTRSHRLNHDKYRPFGYFCRFKSHLSAANSKENHCSYLNATIRKYGPENFTCEKILDCQISELDEYEIHYISEYETKYPNGYNLTNGGQKKGYLKGNKIVFHEPNPIPPNREKKSLKKSDETKKLISERIKEAFNNEKMHNKLMIRAQKQHLKNKFERYKNVTIDESNIDKYLHVIHNNKFNYDYIRVIINKIRTGFIGKYENIEDIKESARTFIKELIIWQRIQIAGNPTNDMIPFTIGHNCEEHG